MPFNGAGVYSPPGADFPAVTQTVISSTHYNNVINDLATGLSLCLTKDGQQVAAANIPFGGFRATNVGITAIAGSVGTPAINLSDATTGFYRSAVSEIAVSISGTQVARFDSTGIVMTGALSGTQLTLTTAASRIIPGVTSLSLRNNANNADNLLVSDAGAVTVRTTLTATTSVVTPLVGTDTATDLTFKTNGTLRWIISETFSGSLISNVDNTLNIGEPTKRVKQVFTPIVDSGTAASLSLKTNNGTTQLELTHAAGANHVQITSGANPTIAVSGGSLAITPSVVISGSILQVGTNPSAMTGINMPFGSSLASRNSANSADLSLLKVSTFNSVVDVLEVGANSASNLTAGVIIQGRSGGAAPNASDLPASHWTVWRDTGGATTKLYYNNAGAIQSVALA